MFRSLREQFHSSLRPPVPLGRIRLAPHFRELAVQLHLSLSQQVSIGIQPFCGLVELDNAQVEGPRLSLQPVCCLSPVVEPALCPRQGTLSHLGTGVPKRHLVGEFLQIQ
jgi:hypothetical protein